MNRPMHDGGAAGRDGGVQTLKAVVLIVVLVAVGVAVLARSRPSHSTAATTATHPSTATTAPTVAPPAPTTTTPAVPPTQVKVQVLNGVLTGSLAGEWSTKLHSSYGYIVEPADNATARVTASAIYVLTPGYGAEAGALATTVGLAPSAVHPYPPPSTAPIPASERSTANLALIIGPDLAGNA